MKYTIIYKEAENKYEMNGILEDFVGDHLYTIATENNLPIVANSESHHIAILEGLGIEIDLLEEDGSRMVW